MRATASSPANRPGKPGLPEGLRRTLVGVRRGSGSAVLLTAALLPAVPALALADGRTGAGPGETRPSPAVERSSWVMGTELLVRVEASDRERGLAAAEAATRAVEEMNALLSTWDPGTPLSELNRSPVDVPVRPAPELAGLLAETELWSRRTGRAFDPAVGSLVDAWDLRGPGRRPDARALAEALAASGRGGIQVDLSGDRPDSGPATTTTFTRLRDGAWMDSGGFGKGAALREATRLLRDLGVSRALLNLGGQIAVLGDEPSLIEVADPRARDRSVARLFVHNASVATSGLSERWTEVDGARLGHILDPRTGRPAEAWGSVTVVASDPLVADILSTALYVMGPEEGLRWARTREDVAVLLLRSRSGDLPEASWNAAMERWLAAAPGLLSDAASGLPDRSDFRPGSSSSERNR